MPSILGRIGARLRDRPDSEHEQAIVRFAVGAVASYYLLHLALEDGVLTSRERTTLWLIAILFCGAVAIFALIVARPGVSVPRRYAGMVLDLGVTTAALAVNGRLAAPVFPVYLWVTFGNGFRYGARPLAVSAVLSVAGFGAAVLLSDLGGAGPHVVYGLLVGLIVLPLYVSFLLAKLTGALEQARAADDAKARFLSNVSHEVRTPLHGILGITEVLLDGRLTPEQRRSVQLVHRSASWLLEVLDAVLEVSRLRAGRAIVEESDFDLAEAVEGVVEFHREVSGPGGPQVELRIGAGVPRTVRGDRVKLLQVLQNLLRNALKFTAAGRVSVTVENAGSRGERTLLRFSVADGGTGVPAEARPKVPGAQARAEGATGRTPQGEELGPAIARDLVSALDGTIDLEGEPGRNMRVAFTIPLAPAETPAPPRSPVQPPSSLPAAPAWRARPRILVAEDNAINRELIAKLLDRFGCAAAFAENGVRAVEAVSRERFDLVLMDCQMPEMDGYEATREIRRRLPQAALPIVAVTAYTSAEYRDRCRDAGMDDFIAKPFRASELLEVLARWLTSHIAAPGTAVPAIPRPDDLIGAGMPSGGIAPRAAVHEINNALTGLLGYADLLAMGLTGDQRLKGYADRIVEAGERARQILLALPRG